MPEEKTKKAAASVEEVLAQDKAGDISSKGFMDTLYEEIVNVIGGDSPNQYFCMTLPGTILDPDMFSYDTTGTKPAHVKVNESRLVNKLYDASFIAAADNGKTLPNQNGFAWKKNWEEY